MPCLVKQAFVEPGHPIEDSWAGFHLGLPIVPIEIPADGTSETSIWWNAVVASVVKKYIKPDFDRLCQDAGIILDLEGFDISRILSLPGTWRHHNPAKPDGPLLMQGYLRRWLPPYVDDKYPVHQENMTLTELIQAEFERLQHEVQTAILHGQDDSYVYPHASSNALTDDELLRRALNVASFAALWYGDTSAHNDDWSRTL